MEDVYRNQPGGQGPPGPPRTSGLAIASLILALLAIITCLPAPLALVLGIVALVQTGRQPSLLRGRGKALAGTIISGIVIVLYPILVTLLAIAIPNFIRARDTAQRSACLNNLKQISMAMMMYVDDYDGRYPTPERWNDLLEPYIKNPDVLICPKAKGDIPSYAMNDRLARIGAGDVSDPGGTVMLFESVPGKNQSGSEDLMPEPPRHAGSHTVCFADGHAEAVEEYEAIDLNWDPQSYASEPYWDETYDEESYEEEPY